MRLSTASKRKNISAAKDLFIAFLANMLMNCLTGVLTGVNKQQLFLFKNVFITTSSILKDKKLTKQAKKLKLRKILSKPKAVQLLSYLAPYTLDHFGCNDES